MTPTDHLDDFIIAGKTPRIATLLEESLVPKWRLLQPDYTRESGANGAWQVRHGVFRGCMAMCRWMTASRSVHVTATKGGGGRRHGYPDSGVSLMAATTRNRDLPSPARTLITPNNIASTFSTLIISRMADCRVMIVHGHEAEARTLASNHHTELMPGRRGGRVHWS